MSVVEPSARRKPASHPRSGQIETENTDRPGPHQLTAHARQLASERFYTTKVNN